MSIPRLLDHIVLAGPHLEEVVRWFEDRTGIHAAPGGSHPTGTANALVALTVDGRRGPCYLELIGPDPAAAGEPPPTKFRIAELEGPTLVTYAVHPEDIDAAVAESRAAGHDPGDVVDLSRRTPEGHLLRWRLTRSPAPPRYDLPFFIDWGDAPHPGLSDVPQLELVSFEQVGTGPRGPRFRLLLRLEDGRVVEI